MKYKLKKEVNIWDKFGLGIFLAIAYSPLLLLLLKTDNYELKKEVEFKNITVEDMCNTINDSTNLNEEEKEYLINEDLYADIVNCINREKKENNILNALNEYDIIPMSEEKKNQNPNLCGYYNRYSNPNHIYIRDYEDGVKPQFKSTISHEHIHSLEYGNKFKYIHESATSIINDEYYCLDDSYMDEKIRLKVLMEIIGPTPIWNLCFLGDTNEIKNIFNEYLSVEDRDKFLELLSTIDDPQHEEIDNLLSKLYFNIYGKHIENDEVISAIYNNLICSRKYFNITDEYDTIYEPIDKEIIKKENLLIEIFHLEKRIEVSKDCNVSSYLEKSYLNDYLRKNNDYIEKKGYLERHCETEYNLCFLPDDKIKIEIESNLWKEYSLEEAEKLGYIKSSYFLRKKISTNSIEIKDLLIEEGYNLQSTEYICNGDEYQLISHNGEVTLGTEKEIPTIKDKFETSNVKKLVKE